MSKDIISEISTRSGKSHDEVHEVIGIFMELLHKKSYEYNEFNGDYIGEELPHIMSNQAYYHLLGFLNNFDDKYSWEQSASEYLARLGSRETWQPFAEQMQKWNKPTKE